MDKITTATDGLAKKKYKYSIKEKYLCFADLLFYSCLYSTKEKNMFLFVCSKATDVVMQITL